MIEGDIVDDGIADLVGEAVRLGVADLLGDGCAVMLTEDDWLIVPDCVTVLDGVVLDDAMTTITSLLLGEVVYATTEPTPNEPYLQN